MIYLESDFNSLPPIKLSQSISNELWNRIEREAIKKITIETAENRSIIFRKRVIKQLLEVKPPIDDLSDEYTLLFKNNACLTISKAKLLLCGEFMVYSLKPGFREAQTKTIDFTKSVVSYEIFKDILHEVETGEPISLQPDAADFLMYSPWIECFGTKAWEKLGIKTEAPPLPKNFYEAWIAPCPIFKEEKKRVCDTHVLVLIPAHTSINMLNTLAQKHMGAGFTFIQPILTRRDGDVTVDEPYWAIATKTLIPGSDKRSRDELFDLVEKTNGYTIPSLLEAIATCFIVFANSGERILSVDEKGECIYTCCREEPVEFAKVIVGDYNETGISVSYYLDCVGIGTIAIKKLGQKL